MKIFIDTGNLQDIQKLVPLGIIDGITTNPSLLAKEPGDYKQILKSICQLVQGPVSAEVVATDGVIVSLDRLAGVETIRPSLGLATVAAGHRRRRGHQPATRSPSRPVGRNTRTRMSTPKAKTSCHSPPR